MKKDKENNDKALSRDLKADSGSKSKTHPSQVPPLPPEYEKISLEKLIDELRERQVEIEMQNEALKCAQLAIEEARDRYAKLYDYAPVGYFTLNHDGLIVQANLTGAAHLGVVREELINKRFRDFVAPADLDRWDRHITSVFQHGVKQHCELMLNRPGGDPFCAHVKSARVELPYGMNKRPEFAVYMAMADITERKRGDDMIKNSESLFKNIITVVPVGLGVASNRVIEWANDFFLTLVGRSKEEIFGQSTRILYETEEAFAEVGKLFYESIRTCGRNEIEVTWKHKDGRILNIYLTGVTLEGGIPFAKIIFCALDITERKRMENRLRESEWQWNVTFDSIKECICLINPNGQILKYNQAMERLYGKARGELSGQFCYNVMQGLDQPIADGPVARMRETKRRESDILRVGERWFEILVDPILDKKRSVLGAVYVIQDITERKQMEKDRADTIVRQSQTNILQQRLLSSIPFEDKLKAVTDGIVRIFDADFCRIWLIKPGDLCEQGCIHAQVKEGPDVCLYRDRCLHLMVSSGRYTHTDGKIHRRVPFGSYKIGRIASGEDHKFLTNGAQNDPRVHDHQWASELGMVSFAGYQLRVSGGETLGVLALFAKHPISLSEDAMLDGISSSVALVVQQAIEEKSRIAIQEQLKELFDNTHGGIAIYSAIKGGEDFVFVNINKAGERISKVCRDEVIGKSVLALFPGIKKVGLFQILQQVWRSGQPQHCPVSWYQDERLSQWIENYVYKLPSGEIVAMYDDITERREIEEKEQKHLQDLEVFYRASIGREERIIELKKEIERLKQNPGK